MIMLNVFMSEDYTSVALTEYFDQNSDPQIEKAALARIQLRNRPKIGKFEHYIGKKSVRFPDPHFFGCSYPDQQHWISLGLF